MRYGEGFGARAVGCLFDGNEQSYITVPLLLFLGIVNLVSLIRTAVILIKARPLRAGIVLNFALICLAMVVIYFLPAPKGLEWHAQDTVFLMYNVISLFVLKHVLKEVRIRATNL
jgi:hypothetical protein